VEYSFRVNRIGSGAGRGEAGPQYICIRFECSSALSTGAAVSPVVTLPIRITPITQGREGGGKCEWLISYL
jgi:hypothetical protein